jgi:hypothetical protein
MLTLASIEASFNSRGDIQLGIAGWDLGQIPKLVKGKPQ